MKRLVSFVILLCFIVTGVVVPLPSYAEGRTVLSLPVPGQMMSLSVAYTPVMIKGLKVYPENPLMFDFIVDTGNSKIPTNDQRLKQESQKLIKYFLASLTIPEDDLWVNLSPYEKDHIIPQDLEKTELGRDMLAQDYILKQLSASLIYPEKDLGKTFWDKVYTKAHQMYGVNRVPVNTFNKVWIVADKAKVLERNNVGYVVGAHLKVMLEEDYLAKNKNIKLTPSNQITSQIIRDIVLPELEKEVNQGQNFAPLRQMFYSMILATWYKQALKDAFLNKVYSNKAKVGGIQVDDPAIKEKIYQQYLSAYKKGVFNYIKEDLDLSTHQRIPRKYFSGGIARDLGINKILDRVQKATLQDMVQMGKVGNMALIQVGIDRAHDNAMLIDVTTGRQLPSLEILTIIQNLAILQARHYVLLYDIYQAKGDIKYRAPKDDRKILQELHLADHEGFIYPSVRAVLQKFVSGDSARRLRFENPGKLRTFPFQELTNKFSSALGNARKWARNHKQAVEIYHDQELVATYPFWDPDLKSNSFRTSEIVQKFTNRDVFYHIEVIEARIYISSITKDMENQEEQFDSAMTVGPDSNSNVPETADHLIKNKLIELQSMGEKWQLVSLPDHDGWEVYKIGEFYIHIPVEGKSQTSNKQKLIRNADWLLRVAGQRFVPTTKTDLTGLTFETTQGVSVQFDKVYVQEEVVPLVKLVDQEKGKRHLAGGLLKQLANEGRIDELRVILKDSVDMIQDMWAMGIVPYDVSTLANTAISKKGNSGTMFFDLGDFSEFRPQSLEYYMTELRASMMEILIASDVNQVHGMVESLDLINKLSVSNFNKVWKSNMDLRGKVKDVTLQSDHEKPIKFDEAMLNAPGGIDLNAHKMGLEIAKEGLGVDVKFDPALMAEFRSGNFSGVVPVILKITPIEGPLPLLGLSQNQEFQLAYV